MFIIFYQINAQEYYNRLIPFDFGNPTVIELIKINEKCYIPVIYYSNTDKDISTIVEIKDTTYDYHHYEDFTFASTCYTKISDMIFFYGKKSSVNNDLRIMRVDENLSPKWIKSYKSAGYRNFKTDIINLNRHIYISYSDKYKENSYVKKEIGIKKIDTLGNEIWTHNYNTEYDYSYPWTLNTLYDSTLLLSSTFFPNQGFDAYAQIIKIDTLGNEIWKYVSDEEADGGSAPVWPAQLSDSNIVMVYPTDKFEDVEFINYNRYPPALIWVSDQGKSIRQHIFKIPKGNGLYFHGLKRGLKKGYFFTYGNYDKNIENTIYTNHYGVINKFSNEGDTIWSHRYQHTLFDTTDLHGIDDIIEMENGDIVALGEIRRPGSHENGHIWMFRVNSHGCFEGENCETVQRTDVKSAYLYDFEMRLYPNPAKSLLNVSLPDEVEIGQWRIYNMQGKKLLNADCDLTQQLSIDVSVLDTGMYILMVIDSDNKIAAKSFVKD